uniref:uncharacterized protein LOC125908389 n=1 Tax=Anopheles coluzzii TaxID=1518534 RepID=UPI0020FF8673|nr:uncharacterized protein LOC125908389 [Anopheles coluzzii]
MLIKINKLLQVSRHSISRIVKETCACLIEALRDYVKLPSTEEEWLAISRRFEQRWRFPHAIGAIDGKHVEIICPRNSGSEYHNYQKIFSIVLMVVVDADYNFLWADAGGKGGISDGGIFINTRLYHKLENDQLNIPPATPLQVPYQTPVLYFILGDKAFAFTNYCLRPYSGVHPSDSMERTFNKMHSTCRMPVENSLGLEISESMESAQRLIMEKLNYSYVHDSDSPKHIIGRIGHRPAEIAEYHGRS